MSSAPIPDTGPAQRSNQPPPQRHAVVGDVGGHYMSLVAEVCRLGGDPFEGMLPDDLTIVQVGDLVHRGPSSEAVVDLVGRFLEASRGQWVQLVGNHEAQYLRHPAFHWNAWVEQRTADTLRRWWADGRLRAAAVVETPGHEYLVTHAGVTEGFWRRDLGRPTTARQAADVLNDMAAHGAPNLFRGGRALTGRRADFRAGPLWAEAGGELVASWDGQEMPFSQLHGHSSLYDWQRGGWRVSQEVVRRTTLDRQRSHETTQMRGGVIVGVDPDHGREPRLQWRSWESERATAPA